MRRVRRFPAPVWLVTSTQTGFKTTVTTNELGYYSIPALQPGSYLVEVSQNGFKKTVRELALQVAQVGAADFKLDVGDITQSITVEAGSPVINSADSAIGQVVDGRQAVEMPLNGRNFTQLALLVPGVTRGNPTGAALRKNALPHPKGLAALAHALNSAFTVRNDSSEKS